MAILHGSWITHERDSHFFIWGEMWRPMAAVESPPDKGVALHPFAMTLAELTTFLQSQNPGLGKIFQASGQAILSQRQILTLPTQTLSPDTGAYPILSAKLLPEETDTQSLELQPWQVEGFCLDPLSAVKCLQALPLSSFQSSDTYVGGDLHFWVQVYRWSLDLLTRCKFLPGLYRQSNGNPVARWQPLLDSAIDQARLAKFIQLMPSACRAYQEMGQGDKGTRGQGDKETRGQGDKGTRGQGDKETRGQGDKGIRENSRSPHSSLRTQDSGLSTQHSLPKNYY